MIAVVQRARDLAERLARPVLDASRRERTVIVLLAAYVAIWTIYCTVSTSTRDLHVDMTEALALSHDPSFGYYKHPPMSAWVAGLWFTIFPLTSWAFYLLAISVAAVGLWAAWALSARWLNAEKRVLGLALLTLVPFYNFHALKYNANTVLIPFWALTTLWFLRSFETRAPLYAALAGVAATGAMLTKYWSIFLLAGLAVAAISDARRAAYFRSSAPWITIAVGAALIAPHIYWLIAHDFLPFSYVANRGLHSSGGVIADTLKYLAGAMGYIAVPVALVLLTARPGRTALADTLAPSTPERRLAAAAFWAPLLLPALVALPAGLHINALWTMPAFTLLPVVLLSSPLLQIPPRAWTGLVAAALILPVMFVAASPFVAVITGWLRPESVDHRLLAAAIERAWRETTDRPLRIVAGTDDLAFGAAFHMSEKPSAFPFFDFAWAPYLDEARIRREGLAAVCSVDDQICLGQAQARAARVAESRRSEVEIAGGSFIKRIPPRRYVITTVPPRPG